MFWEVVQTVNNFQEFLAIAQPYQVWYSQPEADFGQTCYLYLGATIEGGNLGGDDCILLGKWLFVSPQDGRGGEAAKGMHGAQSLPRRIFPMTVVSEDWRQDEVKESSLKTAWETTFLGMLVENEQEFLEIAAPGQVWEQISPIENTMPYLHILEGFKATPYQIPSIFTNEGGGLDLEKVYWSGRLDSPQQEEDNGNWFIFHKHFPFKLVKDATTSSQKVSWEVEQIAHTIEELIAQAQVGERWKGWEGERSDYITILEPILSYLVEDSGAFVLIGAKWNNGSTATNAQIWPDWFPMIRLEDTTSSLSLETTKRGEVSCLMAPLSESPEIKALQDLIPEDALYKPNNPQYGRKKHPHITVLFGIVTEETEPVQELVRDKGPIKITFEKKLSIFTKDDYDVVKVGVESKQLSEMNKALTENLEVENDYPDYKPHLTVAYVKKGLGKDFDGLGIEIPEAIVTELEFSNHSEKKTEISIKESSLKLSWEVQPTIAETIYQLVRYADEGQVWQSKAGQLGYRNFLHIFHIPLKVETFNNSMGAIHLTGADWGNVEGSNFVNDKVSCTMAPLHFPLTLVDISSVQSSLKLSWEVQPDPNNRDTYVGWLVKNGSSFYGVIVPYHYGGWQELWADWRDTPTAALEAYKLLTPETAKIVTEGGNLSHCSSRRVEPLEYIGPLPFEVIGSLKLSWEIPSTPWKEFWNTAKPGDIWRVAHDGQIYIMKITSKTLQGMGSLIYDTVEDAELGVNSGFLPIEMDLSEATFEFIKNVRDYYSSQKLSWEGEQEFQVGDKVKILSKSIGVPLDTSITFGQCINSIGYVCRLRTDQPIPFYTVSSRPDDDFGDWFLAEDLELIERSVESSLKLSWEELPISGDEWWKELQVGDVWSYVYKGQKQYEKILGKGKEGISVRRYSTLEEAISGGEDYLNFGTPSSWSDLFFTLEYRVLTTSSLKLSVELPGAEQYSDTSVLNDFQPDELVQHSPTVRKEKYDIVKYRLGPQDEEKFFEKGLHQTIDTPQMERPITPYGKLEKVAWEVEVEFQIGDIVKAISKSVGGESVQRSINKGVLDFEGKGKVRRVRLLSDGQYDYEGVEDKYYTVCCDIWSGVDYNGGDHFLASDLELVERKESSLKLSWQEGTPSLFPEENEDSPDIPLGNSLRRKLYFNNEIASTDYTYPLAEYLPEGESDSEKSTSQSKYRRNNKQNRSEELQREENEGRILSSLKLSWEVEEDPTLIKMFILPNHRPCGDSHRYKNVNGEISCIYPTDYDGWAYEIYCIRGNLFEDIERYRTLEEAEQRIKELLQGEILKESSQKTAWEVLPETVNTPEELVEVAQVGDIWEVKRKHWQYKVVTTPIILSPSMDLNSVVQTGGMWKNLTIDNGFEDNSSFHVVYDFPMKLIHREGLDITAAKGDVSINLPGIEGIPKGKILYRKDKNKQETAYWYDENNKLHRDNGPALIGPKSKEYYQHGNLHNTSGPAKELSNEEKEYWLYGKPLSPEEWEAFQSLKKEKEGKPVQDKVQDNVQAPVQIEPQEPVVKPSVKPDAVPEIEKVVSPPSLSLSHSITSLEELSHANKPGDIWKGLRSGIQSKSPVYFTMDSIEDIGKEDISVVGKYSLFEDDLDWHKASPFTLHMYEGPFEKVEKTIEASLKLGWEVGIFEGKEVSTPSELVPLIVPYQLWKDADGDLLFIGAYPKINPEQVFNAEAHVPGHLVIHDSAWFQPSPHSASVVGSWSLTFISEDWRKETFGELTSSLKLSWEVEQEFQEGDEVKVLSKSIGPHLEFPEGFTGIVRSKEISKGKRPSIRPAPKGSVVYFVRVPEVGHSYYFLSQDLDLIELPKQKESSLELKSWEVEQEADNFDDLLSMIGHNQVWEINIAAQPYVIIGPDGDFYDCSSQDDPHILVYKSRRAANEDQISTPSPLGFYAFSIEKEDFPMKRRIDLEALLPKEVESSLLLQEQK